MNIIAEENKLGSIKEKQQLVEISNLKQQLATMTDNKDSTNKYEAEALKLGEKAIKKIITTSTAIYYCKTYV